MKNFLIHAEKTQTLIVITEYIKKTNLVCYKIICLILLLFSPFASHSQLNCSAFFARLKHMHKSRFVQNNSEQQNLPNPYESVRKSVWKIIVDLEGSGLTIGTGFFISPNQFITNFHVVSDMTDLERFPMLLSHESSSFYPKVRRVLALSALDDLALLETDQSVDSWLNISETSSQDDNVLFTIKYSKDGSNQMKEKENEVRHYNDYEFNVVMDSKAEHGMSGSPVYNENGEVTGVVSAGNIMLKYAFLSVVRRSRLNALLETPPLNCRDFRCILEEKRKLRLLVAESENWHALGKLVGYERAEVSYLIEKKTKPNNKFFFRNIHNMH